MSSLYCGFLSDFNSKYSECQSGPFWGGPCAPWRCCPSSPAPVRTGWQNSSPTHAHGLALVTGRACLRPASLFTCVTALSVIRRWTQAIPFYLMANGSRRPCSAEWLLRWVCPVAPWQCSNQGLQVPCRAPDGVSDPVATSHTCLPLLEHGPVLFPECPPHQVPPKLAATAHPLSDPS